ncbi:MAG: hypothetical protein RAO94_09700 [Candidatus Stygibacter australis]|nr:hypothetical protein [Candidatus Stygibacter australis]
MPYSDVALLLPEECQMLALEYIENVDVALWSTLRTSMCRAGGEKGIATDNLNSRSLFSGY